MANGISIDEYLKYLEQQSATNLRPATQGIPGYIGGIDEVKSDNAALDFLGSLVWGGVHGITWGASEFAAKSKTWEEMNDWERAGWVVGEGLSLFTPIVGPFALLGKGGQIATRTLKGNKYIRKAASDLIKEEKVFAEAILKDATAKGIIPKVIERDLRKQFSRQLPEITTNKHLVEKLRGLNADTRTAESASALLRSHSEGIINKILVDSGMEVGEQASRTLARKFVGQLEEGRYVNDIGQWVTRRFGGKNPGRISQYLGMAAQDFLYLGLHAIGTEKIESLAHGRSTDYADIPMQVGVMSLGFPLIRAIPGGGRESLTNGIKNYFARYKKINYKNISGKPNGDIVVRELLRSNVKGANINIFNSSKLGEEFYKVGGVNYLGKDHILSKVDTMPVESVVGLLNRMRLAVSRELVSRSKRNYWGDLIASAPRMGTGVLFMNYGAFKSGAFEGMSTQELSAHLFMAALMTKGRGAWDHAGKRGYISSEYGDMTKTLDFLQTDYKEMANKIRVMEEMDSINKFGAVYGHNPISESIINIFDGVLEGEKVAWRNTGETISRAKYAKVEALLSSYNGIKKAKNKDYEPITIDQMNHNALDMIKRDLGELRIGDKKVNEIPIADLEEMLSAETEREIIGDYYGNLTLQAGKLGIPFSIVHGVEGAPLRGVAKMLIPPSAVNSGRAFPNIIEYNNLLNKYSSLLNIKVIDELVSVDELANVRGMKLRDYDNALGDITHEFMTHINDRYQNHELYLPYDNNIFLKGLQVIKSNQAKGDIYRVVSGVDTDKQDIKILRKEFLNVFGTGNKLYDDIFANTIDGKTGDELIADKDIAENLGIIKPLYDLMKNLSPEGKSLSPKVGIKSGDLKEVTEMASKMINRLPEDWRIDLYGKGLESYQSRIFAGGNKLSYTAYRRAKDDGLIDQVFDNGILKIIFPSDFAIDNKLAGRPDEARRIKESVKGVIDLFNPHLVGRERYVAQDADLSLWKDVYDEIAHSKVKDFVENIGGILDGLGEDSMVLKQIVSIQGLASKIREEIVSPKKVIDTDKIEEAIAEAELIHKALIAEGNIGNDTSTKLASLITAVKTGYSDMGELPSRVFDDANYIKIARSFDEMISFEMAAESISKTQLARFLVRIENHLMQRDPDLTYTDGKILLEKLTENFHSLLGNKMSEERPLQELIDEFNNTGNWSDAKELIDKIVLRANRFNTHHEAYNDEATKHLKILQDQKKNTERPVNFQELLSKYPSLQDSQDPNKISNRFVADLDDAFELYSKTDPTLLADLSTRLNAVKAVFDSYVYRDIRKRYPDSGEQQQAIESFDLTEAKPLIQNIYGKTNREIIILDHDKLKKEIRPVRHSLSTMVLDRVNTSDPENKYKYFILNGTIKLGDRVINMDDVREISGNWEIAQHIIDKAIDIDMANTKDIYEKLRNTTYEIKLDDLSSLKRVEDSSKVYMRLSPRMRIIFPKSIENIELLNKDFDELYSEKKIQYQDRIARGQIEYNKNLAALEKAFKHLFGSTEQDNSILRLKMMFVHYNRTMGPEFDKMMGRMDQDRGEIEFNSYKRGNQADGGTSTIITKEALEWSVAWSADPDVRAVDQRILNEGSVRLGVLNDESSIKGEDHFFSNKKTIIKKLSDKISSFLNIVPGAYDITASIDPIISGMKSKETQLARIADAFVKKIDSGKYTSLESFFLDGGKFSSTAYAKSLREMKGGGKWNGIKTVIMSNDMLGKGFTVYDPEIARVLDGLGIDLLVGKSVAKTLNLDMVRPFTIDPAISLESGWEANLGNMSSDNFINIPYENFGISFTTHSNPGVNYSSSMFDFQSTRHLEKAKKLYNIDYLIGEMSAVQRNKDYANGDLLRALYKIRQEESGQQLTTENYTLTETLLDYGARESNPLVQQSLLRLIQSDFYKILTSRASKHGEEGIAAADVENLLSNPVYAEFEGFIGDRTYNSIYQYGGGSITNAMSKVLIGADTRGVADIQDIPFIARDKDTGLHIIFSFSDTGKLENHSPLLVAQEQAKAKVSLYPDIGIKGLGKNEWIEVSKNSYKEIGSVLDHLKEQIGKMKNVSYGDLIKLLGQDLHESFPSNKRHDNSKPIALKNSMKKLAAKYDIHLGMSINAIPTAMKDHPIVRIEKVLRPNLNGLTTVNPFDLRVTLQRDLDGDHIYKYLKLPLSMLKDYSNDMGDIEDYRPMDRVEYTPMNMFGFENGVAGKDISSIGFDRIAHDVSQKRSIISTVISNKGTLSYLLNSGLQLDGESFVSKNFNSKNIDLALSDALEVFQRGGEIFQNSFDIWKKTPEISRSVDSVADYFLYGIYPSELRKPSLAHSERSFFREGFGVGDNFQREMLRIMHRTLSKARIMDNEIHDAAGQRQPSTDELRRSQKRIVRFFEHPNLFLIRGLLGNARRERKRGNIDKAEGIISDIVSFFYPGVTQAEMTKVYNHLKNGDLNKTVHHIEKRFTIEKDKTLGIKSSMSGHILDEVIKNPVFYVRDNKDTSDKARTMYQHYDRLRNKLEIIFSFGDVTPEELDDIILKDKYLSTVVQGQSVFKTNKSGILRFVANNQHEMAISSLRLLKNENFPDKNKIARTEDRINITRTVLDVLDRQMSRDALLRKDKDLQIRSIKKVKGDDITWEYRDFKMDGNLYRIRGTVRKDDLNPKTDMSTLEYIGSISNKVPVRVQRGYTYIIDTKPPKFMSVDDPDVRWNRAFTQATQVGMLQAQDIVNQNLEPVRFTKFVSDIAGLRRGISDSYSKAYQAADKRPIDKSDIYYYNSVITDRMIGKFFSDYATDTNVPHLVRYLIQPQIQRNVYYKEGDLEMPYFKMNTHLIQSVFNWMRRPAYMSGESNSRIYGFEHREIIEGIIKDMNNYHDHKLDQTAYKAQKYHPMRVAGGEDWTRLQETTFDVLISDWYHNPVLSKYAKDFILGRGNFTRRRDSEGRPSYYYDYRTGNIDKSMEKLMGCK